MTLLPDITDQQDGMRLDRYLRQQFPAQALASIQRSIRKRHIKVNHKRLRVGDYRLCLGDQVSVPDHWCAPSPDPRAGQLNVQANTDLQHKLRAMLVGKTAEYFVLNKPSGLAVQGGTGLRWHLERLLPQLALLHQDDSHSLHLVHRLDRDTSGLLLIARGRAAAQKLTKWFRERRINKQYLAICRGVPDPATGVFQQAIGKIPHLKGESRMSIVTQSPLREVKSAETHYRVLSESMGHALVQLKAITGRKHQLRVHLAAHGTPIAGDRLYASAPPSTAPSPVHLCLHAWQISLPHPHDLTQQPLYYQVDPPVGWRAHAQALGLHWATTDEA